MHRLTAQATPHNSPGLLFRPSPSAVTAWVSALLEPAVYVGVFVLLSEALPQLYLGLDWAGPALEPAYSSTDRAPTGGGFIGHVDWTMLLLVLALTFPAPDHLFSNRWQRCAQALTTTVMLALVILLCAWATRGLQAMNLGLWASWLLVTPLVHEAALVAVTAGLVRWTGHQKAPQVVVVGTGPMGVRAARAIRRLRGLQVRHFRGWFDWAEPAAKVGCAKRTRTRPTRRLGALQELANLVKAGGVDEIYLTGWPAQGAGAAPTSQALQQLWQTVADSTVTVRWIPDVLDALLLQGQISTLDGLPMIGLVESPYAGVRGVIKRASDVVLATAALLVSSPLMLIIGIAIRLESPGPVLFRQRRLGLNGAVIEVWKLRTMTVTEDGAQVRQATVNDPRVTALGRFLRRTSLDELPQFINVLQGRMSVVGPRPHALAHNQEYRQQVMAYMVRHKVRPGITGWAQVNGFRGETDTVDKMRRRVEHDLYYLQNWSLALDLQIILRTIGLVFHDGKAW
ncbi:MAG: undecaprenyl-phosphate glucose phosphotransferase [Betaproteobacteria bacterium]|jgi:putative colanic acid biosynthesis UDP-glucose lipid carrier transferase